MNNYKQSSGWLNLTKIKTEIRNDEHDEWASLTNRDVTVFLFVDLVFLQLLDDDFLRLMILRFIFCFYTMHLHRAFKVLLHEWDWESVEKTNA